MIDEQTGLKSAKADFVPFQPRLQSAVSRFTATISTAGQSTGRTPPTQFSSRQQKIDLRHTSSELPLVLMIVNALLLLIPISLAMEYLFHAPPVWVFLASVLAIVPLAEWIRRGTEHVAHRSGSTIGGLLNVTFGNVAELVLAIFVLNAGQISVAKAQITGSIIGNSLLGLGLAILVGSWGREKQTFSRERVGLLSSLLYLSMIALILPALFDITERGLYKSPLASQLDEKLSLCVSVVLILVYIANLVYTLVTHRNVFAVDDPSDEAPPEDVWPLWKSVAVLVVGTVFVALESELVSGALEATAVRLGLSTFFLGIIVLAIVGNAAEYVAAIYFARKDQMGLAIAITVGATIQVALLTAPLLVLISYFMGHPMNLVFHSPLELISITVVAFAVNTIAHDGETNWFEGVLLLTVYVLLGLTFYFATP